MSCVTKELITAITQPLKSGMPMANTMGNQPNEKNAFNFRPPNLILERNVMYT